MAIESDGVGYSIILARALEKEKQGAPAAGVMRRRVATCWW